MRPLRFSGEAKLASISEKSKVRVTIEISLPPPEGEQYELEEAREILKESYKNIAEMMARYLGATQYTLMENPEVGLQSVSILFKHFTKAMQEVITIGQEDIYPTKESEREFLKIYQ